MQPAPIRLQQAIWTAFNAAKPTRRPIARQLRFFESSCSPRSLPQRLESQQPASCHKSIFAQARFYSDQKKSDVDKKVDDARQRINETIQARADNVINLPGPEEDVVKSKKDETIVHTLPESSSIVYNDHTPGESALRDSEARASKDTSDVSSDSEATAKAKAESENVKSSSTGSSQKASSSPGSASNPLPSQLLARYSHLRARVTDYMDNFQTHIFTASKRLNDLTGYSSIEALKRSIEAQENSVREARQSVLDAREHYQEAIQSRSDTQREVNDLLHRKHAWSPSDLERFTSLYRSDHANEQSEQKAHEELNKTEQQYEEASNKLSKSILARYHEEQVWSDKIRQMSTWGTWGLMGLNVLLFVVFQILIEPWRRRRLVKGFEEKVQEALREQTAENELRTIFHIKAAQEDVNVSSVLASTPAEQPASASASATTEPETEVATAAAAESALAGAIVEATVASAAEDGPSIAEMGERAQIEQAAETATTAELLTEDPADLAEKAKSESESTVDQILADGQATDPVKEDPILPALTTAPYADLPFILGTHVRIYLDRAKSYVEALFDEKATLTITRKELTNKALEGAFFGALGVVALFWIVGVGAVRGR